MKKLIALTLALAALFSFTACANTTEPTVTDTFVTTNHTEESTAFFPDVKKQDYQGETFRMIGFTEEGEWYYAEELSNGEGAIHVLNDTIYEMNTLVEEHLGVELAYERAIEVRGSEIFDAVKPTIMSGDDEYQLCILHPFYSYNSFISQGYVTDFYELTDLDLEQSYWNLDVMKALEVNGHAYIGLGDICRYNVHVLFGNKDMLTKVNRPVPYDTIRNGEWTLDMFLSMTAELYSDNGDGQKNNQDTYGFAGLWDANGTAFMQGSGIYVVTRNAEDAFELSLYGERLVSMYDKLYNWTKSDSTYIWDFASRENPDIAIDFLDSHAYFTLDSLDTKYLEADFDLAIIPIPKYDTAQENYAHVNWGNNIVVPSSVQNKDMVGQVLELMGFYSETLVQQKYYDDVLQLRVSEAPDDRDMVELIYDTIVYDPGIAFCDGQQELTNLVYLPCFGIRQNIESIASYYQRNERGAKSTLKRLFKTRERS